MPWMSGVNIHQRPSPIILILTRLIFHSCECNPPTSLLDNSQPLLRRLVSDHFDCDGLDP